MQYVEYLENKFDGNTGVLERKHIKADGLVYIRKEANNIEDQPLDITGIQVFGRGDESLKIAIIRLSPRFYPHIGSVLGFFRFYQ
ncbi:hypothetical protein [Methanosarcina sp.]|uniref:hypothetical protein n=1 Tax=Methanosarcina sp. TaxID=2213 RepID=UPI002ABA9621|nr:hypothetical protein [Methanosarcina sp.]MDY9927885.1 hypothetical protein [Methanosarcina sp.]